MKPYMVKTTKSSHYGKACELCPEPFRAGDVALVVENGGSYVKGTLRYHRRCIEAMLAGAPVEAKDNQVAAMRASLIELRGRLHA